MRQVLYAIHLIASIGGGVLGLISLTSVKLTETDEARVSIGLVIAVGLVYLLAIVGGIAYSKDRGNAKLIKAFYALQIPVVASSVLAYKFSSLLSLFVGFTLFPTDSTLIYFGAEYYWGSFWHVWLNPGAQLSFGINLVPLVLLILLCRSKDTAL